MANRRLRRVAYLKEDFEVLDRNKLFTCKNVLSKNLLELMEITNSYNKSLQLLKVVSQIVCPASQTAWSMVKKGNNFLSTMFESLDVALQGGFPTATVVELNGPSGCGKTQFCMTMSANTANRSHSVVYIDTENSFTAQRLVEISENRFGEKNKVSSNVFVFVETTLDSLDQRLKSLEKLIIETNVKLIIVDSIASLARKEFRHQTSTAERNQMLVKQASLLKYYAETFNLSVLVTNQMTFGGGKEVAALGNTWSHTVNTRLSVSRQPNSTVRKLTISKSPMVGEMSLEYVIQAEGIVMDRSM